MKSFVVVLLIVACAAADSKMEYVASWLNSKDIPNIGTEPCGSVGVSSCDDCKQNSYATANMKAGKCSTKASCYEGKCWAYCGPDYSSGPWCYTTKSASQSGIQVSCTDDSECNPCWSCAGSCGL